MEKCKFFLPQLQAPCDFCPGLTLPSARGLPPGQAGKAKPSSPARALCSAISCTIPCCASCEEHHGKRFPGTDLGRAPLCLTHDARAWLLLILRSLMLPFPGQVCSWAPLMSQGSCCPWFCCPRRGWLAPGWLRGHSECPLLCPLCRELRGIPPAQQCQQGGRRPQIQGGLRRCEVVQGWGSQRAPKSAPASLGHGETQEVTESQSHSSPVSQPRSRRQGTSQNPKFTPQRGV